MYIVVTTEQNKNENLFSNSNKELEYKKGLVAYAFKITSSNNLVYELERIGGLKTANIFATKKEAIETMNAWNETFIKNGEYLLD